MKKKKILLIVLIVVLSLSAVAAITFGVLHILDKKNQPTAVAYEHTYSLGAYGVCDDDMTIDGVLDEDIWSDRQWFRNTFISASDENDAASLHVTTAFSTKGVYIAAILEDTNLTYAGDIQPGNNSEIEFYYFVNEDGKATPDGTWIDRINYRYFIIDLAGDLYGDTKRVMRGVTYEGELNSGKTERATYELFMEWSEFGLTVESEEDIPEAFYMLPNARLVMSGASENTILCAPQNAMYHLGNYYQFTNDGYSNADKENAVLGDNYFGSAKSANWIADGDSAAIKTGTDKQTIYFTEAYDENFSVSVDLAVTGTTTSHSSYQDRYFGVRLISTSGMYHDVLLNYGSSYVEEKGGYLHLNTVNLTTLDNFVSSWNHVSKATVENTRSSNYVTLQIIKYGTDLHYYVNGELVLSESASYLSGKIFVGLQSMNTAGEAKNCSYTALSDEEVTAFLTERGFCFANLTSNEGGTATLSAIYFRSGESLVLDLTCENGYAVNKIYINDVDKTSQLKSKAQNGSVLLDNLKQDITVRVEFRKLTDTKTAQIYIQDANGDGISGNVVVYKNNDGLYQSSYSIGKTGAAIDLEAGTYTVEVLNADALYETKTLTVGSGTNTCKLTQTYQYKRSGNKMVVNGDTIAYTASTGEQYLVADKYDTVAYTEGVFNFQTLGSGKASHGIRVETEDGNVLNLYFVWRGFGYTLNGVAETGKYNNWYLYGDADLAQNPYLKYDRKDSYADGSGGSNIALAYRAFVIDDVLYFFTNDKTDVLQDIGDDEWKLTWQIALTDEDFGFASGSKYTLGVYANVASDVNFEHVVWKYGSAAKTLANKYLKDIEIVYDSTAKTLTYPGSLGRQTYLFSNKDKNLALCGTFVSESTDAAYGFTVEDSEGNSVQIWLTWRGFAYQSGETTEMTKYSNTNGLYGDPSKGSNPYAAKDWKDTYVYNTSNKAMAFQAYIVDDILYVYYNDYTGVAGDTGENEWILTWAIDLSDKDFGLVTGGAYKLGLTMSDVNTVIVSDISALSGDAARQKYYEMGY